MQSTAISPLPTCMVCYKIKIIFLVFYWILKGIVQYSMLGRIVLNFLTTNRNVYCLLFPPAYAQCVRSNCFTLSCHLVYGIKINCPFFCSWWIWGFFVGIRVMPSDSMPVPVRDIWRSWRRQVCAYC